MIDTDSYVSCKNLRYCHILIYYACSFWLETLQRFGYVFYSLIWIVLIALKDIHMQPQYIPIMNIYYESIVCIGTVIGYGTKVNICAEIHFINNCVRQREKQLQALWKLVFCCYYYAQPILHLITGPNKDLVHSLSGI